MTLKCHKAALRELDKLPSKIRERIISSVEEYYETEMGDVRHIRGRIWALRVGDYRIYYWKHGDDLGVVGVDHRKSAYIPERVEALKDRADQESKRDS